MMLREIPAMDHAVLGASGIRIATRPASAHTEHTRARAATGSRPTRAQWKESQPPANPPSIAASGGSQARYAASTNDSRLTATRYSVVQLLHSEYVTMLSALASMNPQMRGSRNMVRLRASGSVLDRCAGRAGRAPQVPNGIQRDPPMPLATHSAPPS